MSFQLCVVGVVALLYENLISLIVDAPKAFPEHQHVLSVYHHTESFPFIVFS
jgi:hypothetical protein